MSVRAIPPCVSARVRFSAALVLLGRVISGVCSVSLTQHLCTPLCLFATPFHIPPGLRPAVKPWEQIQLSP